MKPAQDRDKRGAFAASHQLANIVQPQADNTQKAYSNFTLDAAQGKIEIDQVEK